MLIKYTVEEKQKYLDNLPKKHMSAGALFFDGKGKILIVKPTYKNDWTIPGGVIDADESPRAACVREVKEEVNLDITDLVLLCVDYAASETLEYLGKKVLKPEAMHFLFYGGILSDDQVSNIRIPEDELSEYRFVQIDEALALLSKRLAGKLPKCLEAMKKGAIYYLENVTN